MSKGTKHTEVGGDLTYAEYHADTSHTLESGGTFPGSPGEQDRYYRTDLHKWYIYNGNRWKDLISPRLGQSYLIYKDGTDYLAQDDTGNIDYSDTDLVKVIEDCVGSGHTKILMKGENETWSWKRSAIFSNIHHATIKLAGWENPKLEMVPVVQDLTANANQGTYDVTVSDGSAWTVGSRVIISNDDNGNDIFDGGEAWENNKIASIAGNVLTMEDDLNNNYTTALNAFVGTNDDFFNLTNCNNWVFRELWMDGRCDIGLVGTHGHLPNNNYGFGLRVDNCEEVQIIHPYIKRINSEPIDICGGGSINSEVLYPYLECYGTDVNHWSGSAILFYEAENANKLIGGRLIGTQYQDRVVEIDAATDTPPFTERVQIIGVTIEKTGSASGDMLVIWNQSHYCVVQGCTFTGNAIRAIYVHGSATRKPSRNSITGNTIEVSGPTDDIVLTSNSEKNAVIGNTCPNGISDSGTGNIWKTAAGDNYNIVS